MPPRIIARPVLGRLLLGPPDRWTDPDSGFTYPAWQVARDLDFYARRGEPIEPAVKAAAPKLRPSHGVVQVIMRREQVQLIEAPSFGVAAASIRCRHGAIAAFGWLRLPASERGG